MIHVPFVIMKLTPYLQCLYNKKVPMYGALLCHLNLKYETEKCVALRNSFYDKHDNRCSEWNNLFLNI